MPVGGLYSISLALADIRFVMKGGRVVRNDLERQ
jgi:hypothetical protein